MDIMNDRRKIVVNLGCFHETPLFVSKRNAVKRMDGDIVILARCEVHFIRENYNRV